MNLRVRLFDIFFYLDHKLVLLNLFFVSRMIKKQSNNQCKEYTATQKHGILTSKS